MVAGMEECSYSEFGAGPVGELITAKQRQNWDQITAFLDISIELHLTAS